MYWAGCWDLQVMFVFIFSGFCPDVCIHENSGSKFLGSQAASLSQAQGEVGRVGSI